MIISLDSGNANLINAGGKGMNLAILHEAGFNVPDGFILSTEAYETYLEVNDLQVFIKNILQSLPIQNPTLLENASKRIRNKFLTGNMPLILETILREAHMASESKPLAVRSSATAEDLPESSFAGQQDTFLNVIGFEAMKESVINCWSSLWTARAIAYRTRNHIAHENIALAVVIQEMIPAEKSGVLFTANPLNGNRKQLVIDASYGLGEAIVSGLVEPDHYVVDTQTREILNRKIGQKNVLIEGRPEGGTTTSTKEPDGIAAISDTEIQALMDLGEKVQAQFDYPQDVEWAIADGKLFLLQSRPITSLYPKPDIAPEPTQALISFGAIQGMLDPLTPMGQDAIRLLFAGGASLFDYEHTLETQKVLHMAGERLWANLTPVIKNKIGQRLLLKSIGGTEPGSRVFFAQLIEDPLFQSDSGWPKFRTVRRFFKFGRKTALGVIRNMVHPERARKAAIRETDRFLHSFASRARAIGGEPDEILSQRTALFLSLWDSFPVVIPTLAYAALAGLLPFTILQRIGSHAGVQRDRFLELFRGLPHNPTTEMDLAMWQTACVVRDIPEERESFVNESTEVLTTRYLEQRLHPAAQTAISNFLETYGMRGLAEIDFGRPRWNENPKQVIQTLQSYIAIPKNNAPDIVFNQGRRDAENAFEEILEKTRSSRGGFIKTRVLKWAYKRFRALSGLRESPKFFVVRFMGIVRIALLASGTDLVMSKHLQQREDIFFLRFSELSDLSRNKLNPNDLQEIVRSRKTRYQLEMRRKQIPRILMSNGEVFYEKITGFTDDTNLITGSPVSPGTVEGLARVVHDPAQTDLLPGEIIVCRGTDPAWTPLFLTAGGLVMEVGGMMTHGSVVAREYGIPAVVGVHGATETLKTGMKIRVDGSAGTITPID